MLYFVLSSCSCSDIALLAPGSLLEFFFMLLMCAGKNRPLDEDEMEFMNTLADSEMQKQMKQRQAESEELAVFQEVFSDPCSPAKCK